MKTFLSLLTMVTAAPLVAVATLMLWNPERWGGSVHPLAILATAVFGLFTVPLWPTYIPAVAATPFMMRRVARLASFNREPLAVVLGVSFILGVLGGVAVISVIVPWHESSDLVFNWVAAGGMAGGVTLSIVSYIFRFGPKAS